MDAARAAGMSDPNRNPNFRRLWSDPSLERNRPPLGGTSRRAEIKCGSHSDRELASLSAEIKRVFGGAHG
jgi:hypothetical protein